jgi:P4 family phage/plasmid primase-like protien
MRLPYSTSDVKTKLRETHPDYPGIEFKKSGRYVLIPNCLHPDGRYYEWHPLSPYTSSPIDVPSKILDILTYIPNQINPSYPNARKADLAPTDLQKILNQTDVFEFRNNGEKYQQFMMACHFATGGSPPAMDHFVNWSTQDPQYLHHASIIQTRWESLSLEKPSSITTGSLRRFCARRNIRWPQIDDVVAAFSQPVSPVKKGPSFNPPPPDLKKLIEEIYLLAPGAPDVREKIRHYYRQALTQLDEGAVNEIRTALSRSLKMRKPQLDKIENEIYRELKAEAKQAEHEKQSEYADQHDLMIAHSLLNTKFKNNTLIHANNQQFYHYQSKYWRPIPDNALKGVILTEAERLKSESLTLDYNTIPLIPRVLTALEALTAQSEDVLGLARTPKPVLNTRSCEVHIDQSTGETTTKPNSPESYLTYCLPIDYDPKAEAPLFQKFLADIFRPLHEPEAASQLLLELLGYACQPCKPIPLVLILKGSGENGKSSLLEIITALLGADNVLPRSVLEFGNTQRNNHAYASLPGKLILLDDDMGTEIRLPSSTLKKLSENKLCEANPKGLPTYNFTNTATPVILTNNYPQIPDLSRGLQRRLVVIPFNSYFPPGRRDRGLIKRIMRDELPGIFNLLLEGASRLFKRGYFELSAELQVALKDAMAAGNQVRRFILEATQQHMNVATPVNDLYSHYKHWAYHSYGTTRPYNRADFERQLYSADFHITITDSNEKLVEGLAPLSLETPDNVVPLNKEKGDE